MNKTLQISDKTAALIIAGMSFIPYLWLTQTMLHLSGRLSRGVFGFRLGPYSRVYDTIQLNPSFLDHLWAYWSGVILPHSLGLLCFALSFLLALMTYKLLYRVDRPR